VSPVEIDIIRRKLAIIIENLEALKTIQGMSREDYAADIYKRKATERLLQELIEAAVDINTHIIVETGNQVPDYYYESFIKMGEIRALPTALAEKLAPSAGLRNRLVHEYDRLDHVMVLAAVAAAEEQYAEYVDAIEGFLNDGE
jgi:uncharacterized protein YutE (UPF0331/DUF86 family)